MNKLNTLLEQHLNAIQQEFQKLPKSQKNTGHFSGIINKLDDSITFMDQVSEIINKENSKMVDFINQNYLDDYTDEEMADFLDVAKEKYAEIIKNGFINTLN